MIKAAAHISNLLFPVRCPFCKEIVQRADSACPGCEAQAVRAPQLCSETDTALNLSAVFEYKGVVQKAIHRFKFGDERQLDSYFAEEMVNALRKDFGELHPDIVTCVPQTKRRRRERGFNQAALLAKRCAKKLGVPSDTALLQKIRETADQHTLIASERQKNVKGAFKAKSDGSVRGKTVLLCDDIKTTGATLCECRKALLAQGAAEVYCAVIAVTPLKKSL